LNLPPLLAENVKMRCTKARNDKLIHMQTGKIVGKKTLLSTKLVQNVKNKRNSDINIYRHRKDHTHTNKGMT
jgi:hypothetical protein